MHGLLSLKSALEFVFEFLPIKSAKRNFSMKSSVKMFFTEISSGNYFFELLSMKSAVQFFFNKICRENYVIQL
jgi:hypothetical protein